MAKEEKSEKGQVHSPANREQVIANAGGLPPKKSAEEILNSNTPPKRYAADSTTGLGKP